MQITKSQLLRFFPLAVLFGLIGCSAHRDAEAKVGKLNVVATYSVLGDFVHNVAGDQVALTTLVGGDGDTHTFEPAPQDSVALAKADVIFENGVGFEGWLDKLYTSSQSKAVRRDDQRAEASRCQRPRRSPARR